MMRRLLSLAAAITLLLTLTLTAGAASELPQLHCEAALVVAPETGFVLYSKNDLAKRSPSSLVKIMTALVVLENVDDLTASVTVSAQAVANLKGLATSSLKEGEVMTVTNLLYCLLLNSGADAANALAEYTAGSIPDFVTMMNTRAAELGMTDTQFANPHGGDDASQYTTAADLAKLAVAAMKNQQLKDIVEIQYKRIPKTNKTNVDRYYFSNNALVISSTERRKTEDYYYKYADGLMTGYSAAAGYNLLASSKKDGLTLVTVVLGATRNETTKEKYSYTDAIALMNWGYGNFKLAQLLTKLEPVTEAPVTLSSTTDSVTLVAPDAYTAIIPADVEPAAMSREVTVDSPLEAPLTKGEAVGEIVFSYNGLEYGRSPLVSQSEIERSFLLFALARISGFLVGPWLYASVGGLLFLGGLYAYLTVRMNRRRKSGGKYRG